MDLPKSSLRYDSVDEEAACFLIVCGEVLDTSTNTGGLMSLDVCCCQLAIQERVFAVGFEVPSPKGCSRNAHYGKYSLGDILQIKEEKGDELPVGPSKTSTPLLLHSAIKIAETVLIRSKSHVAASETLL